MQERRVIGALGRMYSGCGTRCGALPLGFFSCIRSGRRSGVGFVLLSVPLLDSGQDVHFVIDRGCQ